MLKKLSVENEEFLPILVELVAEGETATIIARGNSMRPFIEDGRDKLVFGRADKIARAYQREHGEAELGLREIWYQFDWFSAKVIDGAIEFAINFKDEKETDND